MKINSGDFRVREGDRLTSGSGRRTSNPHYLLEEHVEKLSALQQLHYASNRYALLIFQAMDTAGEHGTIRHVMSVVNPQGCLALG
jgi:polyphosphate kinase 2 (PPK2 family)